MSQSGADASMHRRQVLARLAGAGAGIWAAPSLVTLDRAVASGSEVPVNRRIGRVRATEVGVLVCDSPLVDNECLPGVVATGSDSCTYMTVNLESRSIIRVDLPPGTTPIHAVSRCGTNATPECTTRTTTVHADGSSTTAFVIDGCETDQIAALLVFDV